MAIRTSEHIIGDLGHLHMRLRFAEAGYSTGDVSPDYGEDFVVRCHDEGVIEPFRIYVQAKTTAQRKPSWSVSVPTLTARNWVLGNDMTILIRCHLPSGRMYYTIPEDELRYGNILQSGVNGRIRFKCSIPFTKNSPRALVLAARIRHYDHLVRLVSSNPFEENSWDGIQEYRIFVAEFLTRIGLLDRGMLLPERYLSCYIGFCDYVKDAVSAQPDMTHEEAVSYAACYQMVLARISELAGEPMGAMPSFVDKCAVLLHFAALEASSVASA